MTAGGEYVFDEEPDAASWLSPAVYGRLVALSYRSGADGPVHELSYALRPA